MDKAVRVAVVRSDSRRHAVAEALALIADDVRAVVRPRTLIKPNLVSHKYQAPSTHADTLSVALDFVLASGAERVTVAEGASDASAGFERLGHRRACFGRPVEFLDINRDESAWSPLGLVATDGSPLEARLSRTVEGAECRVSLALMKTHVTAMLTCSLKNMLSSVHPSDRVMMHGHKGGGNGYGGLKGLVVEFLKGDNPLVRHLTRGMGHARNLRNRLRGLDGPRGWERLGPSDLAFLRTVEAMSRNLVRLNRRVRPHLAIADGFVAMHREGPRHGNPARLGVVVAGTDPVAVDATAARVMGFDPWQVGYLSHAATAGLGVIDAEAIRVLGDPIEEVGRRLVPHSNHAVQRHWARLVDGVGWLPGPHASPSRANHPSLR
jgi:uncharacterized protein (DUF362 family)